MNDSIKLKPCPFCGDSNVRVYIKGVDRVKYGACCENCDARAGRKPTKEEAAEAWNTRVYSAEQ